MKSHDEIKGLRKCIGASFDVDPDSFEIALIQDESIKRLLARYDQVSVLNTNNFVFAIEISPKAFTKSKKERNTEEHNVENPHENVWND